MMRARFPSASGRTARRALNDLLSSGAAFELADKVAADPTLVGQETTFRFLASDVMDLYLKGSFGDLVENETVGNLTLTQDGDDYIVSSTDGDFLAALARVKEGLLIDAQAARRQAAMQDAGVKEFQRRADAAGDVDEKTKNEALVEQRAALRDNFLATADDLVARSEAEGGDESLGEANRSVLIRVADGWLKMTRITPTGGVAEAVIPMEREVTASNTWELFTTDLPEASRKVSDSQIVWIETLREAGSLSLIHI